MLMRCHPGRLLQTPKLSPPPRVSTPRPPPPTLTPTPTPTPAFGKWIEMGRHVLRATKVLWMLCFSLLRPKL